MTKVSVIIPCYNLGKFLNESIESVLSQTFRNYEIIVVNDGSTDKETIQIINGLNNPLIKVVQTSNQGLSATRNTGISLSKGDYILPLDADDKIEPSYLEKAVKILDENDNIGIVYCEAMFFGEEIGKWELPEYSLPQILLHNVIFSAAVFRKSDWKKVNGYKSNLIYGWEDYDFWLSLIELKREVYKIPEILFFYRRLHNSMSNLMKLEQHLYSYQEIFKNHKQLYTDNIDCIFEQMCVLNEDKKRLIEEVSKLQRHQSVLQMKVFNWRILSYYLLKFLGNKMFHFLGLENKREKSLSSITSDDQKRLPQEVMF